MANKKKDAAKGTVTVFTVADPNSVEDTYADLVFTHEPLTREEVYRRICGVAKKADRERPDEWSMDLSDVEDTEWLAVGLTPHHTPHPWIKVEGDTEIDEDAEVKP